MPYPQWTRGVHHDGSALYVSNVLPTLDETVEIRLRVPLTAPVQRVFLRSEPDGEQHFTQMSVSSSDALSVWYTASLTMRNRLMPYRFKLMTDAGAFYLTARGINRADLPNTFDFKLLADFESPAWLEDAVFYQIFPDRFYNGDPSLTPPEGLPFEHPPQGTFYSQQRNWDAPPLPFAEGGTVDFFGGDLPGIEQKLDYLQDLGITALYLNPIFTSPSNHRYNTSDFYSVDPYLGGDDALISLSNALHARDMRYVLDITPNHVGHTHKWFTAAQADLTSPTAGYFTFYNSPNAYENWLGVSVLPKLNYRSAALRDVMFHRDDAVMRYWLLPPFNADGWRLDVWNMTARQGAADLWHEAGRELRQSVKSVKPEAYVFGENFFDSTPNLQGDELDATMNYQGFAFPVWRWLAGHDINAWMTPPAPFADPVPMPAEATVEQMQTYMAAVPWAITRMQFNLLGSHDTPRIASVVNGDAALNKLAVVLLMTFPGVPNIYYGDEIGMEGWRDPSNRHTMIWDEARWNADLRGHYQRLIDLRRTSDALRRGGFQFLAAAGGLMAYARASADETLVIIAYRGGDDGSNVRVPVWQGAIEDGTLLSDVLSGREVMATGGEIVFDKLTAGDVWLLRAK